MFSRGLQVRLPEMLRRVLQVSHSAVQTLSPLFLSLGRHIERQRGFEEVRYWIEGTFYCPENSQKGAENVPWNSNRLRGSEALKRWNSPKFKILGAVLESLGKHIFIFLNSKKQWPYRLRWWRFCWWRQQTQTSEQPDSGYISFSWGAFHDIKLLSNT